MKELKARLYYGESMQFINVPKEAESIGNAAFSECHNLQIIWLPENLKEIGMSAFYNCHSLERICIPDKVRKIGPHAFYGCHSLKEFIVSEKNAWFSVRDGMLFNKSGETLLAVPYGRYGDLTEIAVPPGTIRIGRRAFYKFHNLKKIILPEGLQEIQEDAFCKCTELEIASFPESLYSIQESAFSGCNLQNIIIPDTVTEIGEYAFSRNYYRHLEYRGVVLNILNEPSPYSYWNGLDVETVLLLIEHADFSISIKNKLKYDIFLQMAESEKHREKLREHLGSALPWLIDCNYSEGVQKLLSLRIAPDADHIDEMIRYAIDKQSYDIQLMLTEYKRKYIGYRNIADTLKL